MQNVSDLTCFLSLEKLASDSVACLYVILLEEGNSKQDVPMLITSEILLKKKNQFLMFLKKMPNKSMGLQFHAPLLVNRSTGTSFMQETLGSKPNLKKQ